MNPEGLVNSTGSLFELRSVSLVLAFAQSE